VAFGKWKRVGLYTAVVVGGRAVCLRLPRVYHKHTFLLFSCVFACAPSRSAPAAAAAASVPAAHARWPWEWAKSQSRVRISRLLSCLPVAKQSNVEGKNKEGKRREVALGFRSAACS
jgi:hypothetical protein